MVFALHVICVVAAIIVSIYLAMWLFEKNGEKIKTRYVRVLYLISLMGASIAFIRYLWFGNGIELARMIGVCASFIWCYGLAKAIHISRLR